MSYENKEIRIKTTKTTKSLNHSTCFHTNLIAFFHISVQVIISPVSRHLNNFYSCSKNCSLFSLLGYSKQASLVFILIYVTLTSMLRHGHRAYEKWHFFGGDLIILSVIGSLLV